MLEFGAFLLAIISTYIAYLQLKNTSPNQKPRKNNGSAHRHIGIPSISFLLRSLFTKYPRSIFLIPLALFGGLKLPDIAIWASIVLVFLLYLKQTPSKKVDVLLGGVFFVSAACIGVWLRDFDIVRRFFEEIRIF